MTTSRARLVAAGCGEPGRILHAAAAAPQRWTLRGAARDGFADVVHQLLGDGVFGGEVHRTTVTARPGARLAVRAVTATPLRGPAPSATVTHLRAGSHATLLYLPGALIPQSRSDHASVLRIEAAPRARVLAAAIVVPGRVGMGERGAFRRLRLRTVVTSGGQLALAEDTTLDPCHSPLDSPAAFAGAEAALTVLALGDWPLALPAAWEAVAALPGVTGGASALRLGGVTFRALCASLGAALEAVAAVESLARVPSRAAA